MHTIEWDDAPIAESSNAVANAAALLVSTLSGRGFTAYQWRHGQGDTNRGRRNFKGITVLELHPQVRHGNFCDKAHF
jgi:hypothetical protein